MSNTRNTISFVLDGKIRKIDFSQERHLRPTTTVLNYLRGLSDHKGTKEGCAEGDCGACSVALAEPEADGKMQYKAFDSCLIFLPMIHGKQLITVESLGTSRDLHPVQKAMVETGGSQCGYCTPGFIMSLFSLYKNSQEPSRAQIDDALTGNLCRCTGYRPIVEAAAQSCVHNGKDHFTAAEPSTQALLDQIRQEEGSIVIQSKGQSYFRPATFYEALEIRRSHPDATIISGSTDIGLLVTKQKKIIPKILDLSGLSEIRDLSENATEVTVGSGVSLERVKAISETHFPALFDMLAVFGSVQIRNMATLGGNMGTASPIGDTPPVLMAYDAEVVLSRISENGTKGIQERRVKALDFITGYRQTQVQPDELIHSIIIPKPSKDTRIKSYKISKRKDLDISTVSGGFRLELDSSGKVKDIGLIYGGMAAMTKRAVKAEVFLKGKPWTREIVEQAMDLIEEEFTPISDARSGKEGRRIMSRNLLLKFWSETAGVLRD